MADGISSEFVISVCLLMKIKGRAEAVLNMSCHQSLKTFGHPWCQCYGHIVVEVSGTGTIVSDLRHGGTEACAMNSLNIFCKGP